eukprot:g8614.t1
MEQQRQHQEQHPEGNISPGQEERLDAYRMSSDDASEEEYPGRFAVYEAKYFDDEFLKQVKKYVERRMAKNEADTERKINNLRQEFNCLKNMLPDLGKRGTAAMASMNVDDYDDFNSFLEMVLSDGDKPTTKQAVPDKSTGGSKDDVDTKVTILREQCQEASATDGVERAAEGGDVAGAPLMAADLDSACSSDDSSDDDNDDGDFGDDLLIETDSFTQLPALTVPSTSASSTGGGKNNNITSTLTSEGLQGPSRNGHSGGTGQQLPQLALLLPFVPRLVLQMYEADDPQMPTGPMHMLLDAAVGLFDVSGFSKIADRLEKEEADGGSTSAVESEGVALRRHGSMMPEQGATLRRKGSTMPEQNRGIDRLGSKKMSLRHSAGAPGLNAIDSGRDSRPTANRLRALFGLSMVLGGGRIGETRTNLKKGSAAERLTDYLNYILGNIPSRLLTDTVEMHGGDILKFAGDAIIVCWSPSRELGIELLNSADPVMSSLGLHIGLGASKVLAGHVGGVENRWEFFITGEACEEMNRAEKDAKNMEIVFSGVVGDWIRRYQGSGGAVELATVRLASGNERLVFLKCPPESIPRVLPHPVLTNSGMCNVLKMYIPQPVKIKLKDGVVETAGGIRKITVVFMELLDVDIAVSDDKDTLQQAWLAMVNRTVRKIQEAVCHYDATLRQFIVDDKGTVAIVVFGLPPKFHEDNAARGINLGRRLLRQGVQAKIGVTTGSAFAGVIGVASRQEYAAVGDAVNMSARLMGKAARNTVLCDATTAKEAEDAFSFKEAMRIKELVSNAHVPVGTKTVLVEGERGSGKSIFLSKVLCQLLELDQDRLNWYGAANRTTFVGPSPAAAAGTASSSAATTAAAAAVAAAATAAGEMETNGEVSLRFGRGTARRRSSIVAVGLGMITGGGGSGGAGEVDGGEAGRAAGEVGSHGGAALQGSSTPATQPRKRSSWVAVPNVAGRKRSIETPSAIHPYEPTAARGHLVQHPGFMALMKDPELGKHLPLLNTILPLYNEQAAGAVTSGAQDAAATATPSSAKGGGRTTYAHRGEARQSEFRGDAEVKTPSSPVDESRGCGAAMVIDNAQWLDHNSWELLYLLRNNLPGMIIFAAYRPFSEINRKHNIALKTVSGTLKMNMGRLTATQVMMILEDSFGVQRTNEELLEFLEVTAKGNPRDVIHMMEDLCKEGIVEINLGAVVILKELSENCLKIKDHTSAPVIAKYDELTRGTQQLVQVAAVIGQEVRLSKGVAGNRAREASSSRSSSRSSDRNFVSTSTAPADGGTATGESKRGGVEVGNVDAQINTLVRVGLLERSSLNSVRFVAKYMVTVIYDMILHSKRQDVHKEIIMWFLTRKSFVDLRPHFRFLGKHAMAAGDQDLAVKFLVMAAEVAISCGDPTEAQLACAAVTQAVDDSGASGHLTLLDQVLRETKFHLLVGQTAILSQDWESAEMSLQLASSNNSSSYREEVLDLARVERYGPCGIMLKKCGNDAKILLGRLNKYQEATRSFHRDLLTDNKKVIQAHNQMFVASRGVLSVSHRTDPSVLPRYLRGHNPMLPFAGSKRAIPTGATVAAASAASLGDRDLPRVIRQPNRA